MKKVYVIDKGRREKYLHDNSKVYPADLIGVYKELAEIIGTDNVIEIYEHFKGQQISFPTRIYTKEYILKQIDEDESRPIKKVASQYGYSERRLRQIINESSKGEKEK